jgi:hypothetical protein
MSENTVPNNKNAISCYFGVAIVLVANVQRLLSMYSIKTVFKDFDVMAVR